MVTWNKSVVIETLKKLSTELDNMSSATIRENGNLNLYAAARRLFGSYENALMEAGLESNVRLTERWNKEKIIATILLLKPEELDYMFVRNNHPKLENACKRIFGNYFNALEAAGIDPSRIRERKQWTKENVLSDLENLMSDGTNPNPEQVRYINPALFAAGIFHFGNWNETLKAAGLDPTKIKIELNPQSEKGKAFENLCTKIFQKLRPSWLVKPKFTYGEHCWFPDMYDPDTETWIDFKLSSIGTSALKSIKNYGPICKKLNIVYLYGNKENFDNIEFTSIFSFREETKDPDLIKIFNEISKLINPETTKDTVQMSVKWNYDSIAEYLKNMPKEEMNSYSAQTLHTPVYKAVRRRYGTWYKGLDYFGYNSETLRKRKDFVRTLDVPYTEEIILNWLKEQKAAEEDLSSEYNIKNNIGYHGAAKRFFGSWKEALVRAGIDPLEEMKIAPKQFITKEELDAYILEEFTAGKDIRCSAIRKRYPAMLAKSYKFYGNWSKALLANGIVQSP